MASLKRSSIRRSTSNAISAIHEWLVRDDELGMHGNFLCNWSVIERCHKEGGLLTYIDGATALPVGFQLGGLVRPGILQVRHDFRGKGIGRKLVNRCISLAQKHDECLLYIQCKPSTSIPFWQRMGFTLQSGGDVKYYAYRILEKKLMQPASGTRVQVDIRFFPEERKWLDATHAYSEHSVAGIRTADSKVHLPERVQFHKEIYKTGRDTVVEIEIEGEKIYLDKAKYQEAQKIGVCRCINGFYVDQIKLEHGKADA